MCTNRDKLDRILNKQSSLVFHSFHKSSKLSHPFPEETRSAYLSNARTRKLLSPLRKDSSSISTNNRKVQNSWRVEKKLYNFFIISRLKLLRIRLKIRSWNFSKDIKKEKKRKIDRKKPSCERIEEMAPLSRPGQTWLIRYSSIEISPAALSIHGSRNHHKTRWKSATLGGRHCTIHRVPRGEGRVTNEYAAEERGKRRKLRFRVAMEGEGAVETGTSSTFFSPSFSRIRADFEGNNFYSRRLLRRRFERIVLFGDFYRERSFFWIILSNNVCEKREKNDEWSKWNIDLY